MGCWNKTCGLTNLPIMHGEKTYVFVLERVAHPTDNCYSTHLYRPLLLPFVSTYNDYGGGEDSEGAALDLIMESIKKNLVEIPLGENKYHDIAVTREAWGEELFFEAVHENRLQINTYQGPADVTFVMMRRDIVDDLMACYEFQVYVGSNQGTCGYNNSYEKYKVANVIDDIDAFFDHIIRMQQESKRSWLEMGMIARRYHVDKIPNRVAQWVQHDMSYRYSSVVHVREYVMALLLSGNREQARKIMVDHVRGLFVETFMEATRKTWIPGGFEGSQAQDYDPYRALLGSMTKVMDARDAEYDDQEE